QITRSTLGLYRERDTTPGPVSLREMIETILNFYQRQIQSLGVKIEERFDSMGKVVGVSGELRQVFANIIANAIDALTVSGTTLRFHLYEGVDWRNPKRRGTRVLIVDDGPGMSSDTQANLFHPFFTTKGQKGTGLGLWVSRGIVLKHGGTLHIKSRTGPRHGSCFSIFFPRESKTL